MTTPAQVRVTAPSTMEAGYTFQASVNGKEFAVTVPEGGVKAGEEFDVPYPQDKDLAAEPEFATTVEEVVPEQVQPIEQEVQKEDLLGPKGTWRNGLCSCCEVFCNGLFWMACCCDTILMAQLMSRSGLDCCGNPDPAGKGSDTFGAVVGAFIVYLVLCLLGFGILIWPFWLVYVLVISTKLRGTVRRRFEIGDAEGGCLGDCCCVFWCGCCSAIQMARHTHDEQQYPYRCCAPTGLSPDAPSLV